MNKIDFGVLFLVENCVGNEFFKSLDVYDYFKAVLEMSDLRNIRLISLMS